MEIEPDDYLADVRAKRENVNTLSNQLKEISSQLNEAMAKLKTMEANLQAAHAQRVLAEKEFQRIKGLYEEDLVSKSRFDSQEAALKVAIAQEKAVESQIKEIKSSINTLTVKLKTQQYQIGKAQEELKIAEINLKRTLIVSPRDGRVAKKSVEVGQYVKPGQLLMAIVDEQDIWVGANFKETQIEKK